MALSTNELPRATVKSPRVNVTISKVVFDWIDGKFAGQRNASKKLSAFASFGEHQVSVRTPEAWLKRKSPPGLDSIEIMAARCPELSAQIDRARERLRANISR